MRRRSSDDASSALQAGIYTYELTEEYLVENGISAEQAANESGKHQAILRDDGAFTDSWTTANGSSGSCQWHVRGGRREPRHLQVVDRMLRRLGDDLHGRR